MVYPFIRAANAGKDAARLYPCIPSRSRAALRTSVGLIFPVAVAGNLSKNST